MLELLLFFLALIMIWATWGFWAFVAALVAKLILRAIFKPKWSYDANWGTLIANLATVVVGTIAVNAKWHEPVYTAAAVVIAVVLIAMELKS